MQQVARWDGNEDARLKGLAKARTVAAEVRSEMADQAYADIFTIVTEWRASGTTLAGIAEKLNAEGHTTRRGKPWNPVQVSRVLDRAEASAK